MKNVLHVFKRETLAYLTSPLAYIVIIIFQLLSLGLAFFYAGGNGFLESNDASLRYSFFYWHTWLYIVFPSLLSMRLWSEEHRLGTSEWLFTMPIQPWQPVLGKYLAACFLWLIGLALTFPIVITLFFLGNPDPGPIWTGYIASFLYASACIGITSAISAFTRSQAICAIISVFIIFTLTLIGTPQAQQFLSTLLPEAIVAGISYLSLLTHYDEMVKGVIILRDLLFYISVIVLTLVITATALRYRRS